MVPNLTANEASCVTGVPLRQVHRIIDAGLLDVTAQGVGGVRRVHRDVKGRRPDLVVSAAVLPEWRAAARWNLQAWTSWLAEGTLDVAVPMAYTTDTEEFHRWVDAALAAAGSPDRIWAGVGAYRNPVDLTVEQIEQARAIGVSGIAVFSYNQPSETPPPDGSAAALHRIGVAAFR